MDKGIKTKMENIGYSEVKEYDDFLFGINKNGFLVKITAVKGHKVVNVNVLEYVDGHSYSYYVDLLSDQKECLLEKYFNIEKKDLDPVKKMKLN